MKIFCTEYPLLSGGELNRMPRIGKVFLRSDSSINNSGKILTLPHWSRSVSALPLLVVRIGKAGRHFEPEHAEKYFSEVALGVGFADVERFREALRDGDDPSLSYNFDGALFLSPFYKAEDFPSSIPFVTLRGGQREAGTLSTEPDRELIGKTLSVLSQHYLMKTGDLVTFPLAGRYEEVTEDFRRLYEGPREELLLDLGVRLFSGNFTT